MANPGGKNSPVHFNGLVQNPPVYGDKQKQGDLARTAPVAGAAASGSMLDSARRAGRRGKAPQQASPALAAPAPTQGPAPSYQAQLAQTWAEVAAVPGASPLVQQLAQEAQIGG